MSQGKLEKKLQSDLSDEWRKEGFRVRKTHEMVSSGKPDLRISRLDVGQLDVELKVKDTGVTGHITGVSAIQRITLDEMNAAGMPAVALIWDSVQRIFWLTLAQREDPREVEAWRRIPAVVNRTKATCQPLHLYTATKRFLNERGYRSGDFLRV